jgi:hypothetical protein
MTTIQVIQNPWMVIGLVSVGLTWLAVLGLHVMYWLDKRKHTMHKT